jgi:hypothetical protein
MTVPATTVGVLAPFGGNFASMPATSKLPLLIPYKMLVDKNLAELKRINCLCVAEATAHLRL